MGFFSSVGAWLGGVDLDEEEKRAADIKARDEQLQAERLAQGKINDAAYQDQLKRIQEDYEQTANIRADVQRAGDEEYDHRLTVLSETVAAPLNVGGDIIGAILKGVPWWLWLAALAVIAWQLGWLKKLRA